jgi:hypothetical protein
MHPSKPPTIKREHTSMLRPPLGKKHMPPRVADPVTRHDSMFRAYDWHLEAGWAMLRSTPTVILAYDPHNPDPYACWTVMYGGVQLKSGLSREQAAMAGIALARSI